MPSEIRTADQRYVLLDFMLFDPTYIKVALTRNIEKASGATIV